MNKLSSQARSVFLTHAVKVGFILGTSMPESKAILSEIMNDTGDSASQVCRKLMLGLYPEQQSQ